MNVSDLMSRKVASCASGDTLERAAQIMWEHDCGIVPVVDENRRVIGMITDRDICMAAYTRGRALRDVLVSSTMSRSIQAVHETDRIEKAHEAMRLAHIRRLPVLDGAGRLAGVLSINDLVRCAHVRIGCSSDDVDGNRILLTLAAISGHRDTAGNGEHRQANSARLSQGAQSVSAHSSGPFR